MALRLLKKDPCKAQYPDDTALIQGIMKNESKALNCLYMQSFGKIRQFITQNNGSEQDAEDVFQDAVLAVWNNIKNGKYEKQSNVKLSTYVFQISKYRWFEQLKSAKNKYNTRLSPDYDVVDEQDLEKVSEEAERLNYLTSLFGKLGDKCQTILKMYYHEKMKMEEIANKLDYTAKTAKNEKYRCMQRLKALHRA